MQFYDVGITGAYRIEPERVIDERGFFARTWCRQEFANRDLVTSLDQCSIAYNTQCGTLRGLHYQAVPHEETKLVRCTQGAILDVMLDLRDNSASFGQWYATELTAENHHALYIPRGVAHGYLTLRDESEVFYQMAATYQPTAARGVRWNDPAFDIDWPFEPRVISARDAGFPLWNEVTRTAEVAR